MRNLLFILAFFLISLLKVGTLSIAYAEPIQANNQKSLALLNLSRGPGISEEQEAQVTERLRALLQKTGTYQVISTENMQTIHHVQIQNPLQICDSACALGYGHRLKVRWIFYGTIEMREGHFRIRAKLMDMQSERLVKEELHDCECPLGGVLERIARNFSDLK